MSSESATGLIVTPVPKAFSRPVSRPGVLTGVLMLVTSLLPSLLPRLAVTQGIVSGISFMVGYGLGVAWQWTWNFLGMAKPKGRWWLVIRRIWFLVLALLMVAGMWGFVGWQNDVRDEFGMERITPAIWLTILPVAFVFSSLILVISRLILKLLHFLIRWLGKVFPLRLAVVLGGAALAMILWGLWSGLAVNTFFAVTNQIFAPRDTITPEGIIAPTIPTTWILGHRAALTRPAPLIKHRRRKTINACLLSLRPWVCRAKSGLESPATDQEPCCGKVHRNNLRAKAADDRKVSQDLHRGPGLYREVLHHPLEPLQPVRPVQSAPASPVSPCSRPDPGRIATPRATDS